MGVKKRFIEMVKSGYPEFDPQNDSVEIEFEGGGDSFGSFSYMYIHPNREGSVNLDDHIDLLFQILDESGVEYNWNNAGTTGRIEYNMNSEQEISVSTIVCEEYWGEINEDGEDDTEIWDVTVGDGLENEPEYGNEESNNDETNG